MRKNDRIQTSREGALQEYRELKGVCRAYTARHRKYDLQQNTGGIEKIFLKFIQTFRKKRLDVKLVKVSGRIQKD